MRRQYNKAKSGGGGDDNMLNTYFFVEDISGADNTLQIKKNISTAPTVVLEYSYDQDTWQDLGTISTTATKITIPANGKVYLRGVNLAFGDAASRNTITATKKHNVGGNIMSLLYGEDFIGKYVCRGLYTFCNLFYKNTTLVDAANLRLPATTLEIGCYMYLFRGCTSLVVAPELPATALAEGCYQAMYYECSSLVVASELPATTLVSNCYSTMFYGCRLINRIVALSTNAPKSSYCNFWVSGVATEGVFVMSKEATWNPDDNRGVSGVPNGWTIEYI